MLNCSLLDSDFDNMRVIVSCILLLKIPCHTHPDPNIQTLLSQRIFYGFGSLINSWNRDTKLYNLCVDLFLIRVTLIN